MKTLIEQLRKEPTVELIEQLDWERDRLIETLETVDLFLEKHKIQSAISELKLAIDKLNR